MLLKRHKEQYIRNLAEEVDGHFLVCPAYQALRKLNFKPPSQTTAVCSMDEWIISDHEVLECWAENFEQLYQVDPPALSLVAWCLSPCAGSALQRRTYPDCSQEAHCSSIPGKVLAHILLRRTSDLQRHKRLGQSGLIPGKSTIDCKLLLRIIVERHLVMGCSQFTSTLKQHFIQCIAYPFGRF